jgi:hypothetical protein
MEAAMADANFQDFDARMQRILRQHQRLSKGYVTTVTKDGLIVARPRRKVAPFIPWRSVLGILAVGMIFKVMMFVNLGSEAYEARVARLATGTKVEQVGAYLLAADQATLWLAAKVDKIGS